MSLVNIASNSHAYVQNETSETYKQLPSIFQIEITDVCDLRCPFCLHTTDAPDAGQFIDYKLIELMHARGDFGGSTYIDLQKNGEPTLHPGFGDIVAYMKNVVKLVVGMSTHGLTFRKKPWVITPALDLDVLTISVDSVDPELYHKMRYPAKLDDLLESLGYLFESAKRKYNQGRKIPLIELQEIKTDMFKEHGTTGDLAPLQLLMLERGWNKFAYTRTVNDSTIELQGRGTMPVKPRTLCINPWTSVSVLQNGDVVSCCFILRKKGEDNRNRMTWLGNLWENSLAEIWESDRVKALRQRHVESEAIGRPLPDECLNCNERSPVMVHDQIMSRLVKLRGI